MKRILLVGFLVLLVPFETSVAGLFGPSTYEDCVLDGIKTAKTKEAVATVHSMCRRKFNLPAPSTLLPERMKGDCRVVYDGKNMYPATSKPSGYKARELARDGVGIAIIYVPQEMNTKSQNWVDRMFLQVLNHCDISLF